MNVWDVLIGPSEIHITGAVRIGRVCRALLGDEPVRATITLGGDSARGPYEWGAKSALMAGLMGMDVDDPRIRESLKLGKDAGPEADFRSDDLPGTPPHTVLLELTARDGEVLRVQACSPGDGAIRVDAVNDLPLSLTGARDTLVIPLADDPGVIAGISGLIAALGANLVRMEIFRRSPDAAVAVIETEDAPDEEALRIIRRMHGVRAVRPITRLYQNRGEAAPLSLSALLRLAGEAGGLCEAVLAAETPPHREETRARMREILAVMRDSIREGLNPDARSPGGLLGGQSARLLAAVKEGTAAGGRTLGLITAYALAAVEHSACMGRVVAAPTVAACGVLPAVLFAAQDENGYDDEALTRALFAAFAFGPAAGDDPNDFSVAAAMAAAALTDLHGGTPEMCADAAAFARLSPLVCPAEAGDRVCRNIAAALVAFSTANLALSGVPLPASPDDLIHNRSLR